MPGQGFRKLSPASTREQTSADGVAHDLVGRLFGERLQRLDDGDAGINHGGELAGEHHEIVERHPAALGLAALDGLLADFPPPAELRVEQRGDGGLFGGGINVLRISRPVAVSWRCRQIMAYLCFVNNSMRPNCKRNPHRVLQRQHEFVPIKILAGKSGDSDSRQTGQNGRQNGL